MIDRDGFSTRGSGQLVLMLSGSPRSGAHSKSDGNAISRIPNPTARTSTASLRTYQARLELEQASDVPLEPHLRAVLTLPNGRALSDTEAIRIKADAADSEDLDDRVLIEIENGDLTVIKTKFQPIKPIPVILGMGEP